MHEEHTNNNNALFDTFTNRFIQIPLLMLFPAGHITAFHY